MRFLTASLIIGIAWLVAGCEEPETATYPVSGQPCSPDDAVHKLGPIDCVPPG
jgi:hypothetical protein